MTKKQKKLLKRIIISASLFIITLVGNIILKNAFAIRFPNGISSIIQSRFGWALEFAIYLAIYIYISYNLLKKTFGSVIRGAVLDEEFLMCIASLGAFALGIYTGLTASEPSGFDEACAVIIFYQIGEFFQSFATERARGSIKALLDIKSDWADVQKEGGFERVDIGKVALGDIIRVGIGDKVPADGIIIEGSTALDVKSLTGEALPRDVAKGDEVLSGSVNLESVILIKATRLPEQSTAARIMALVDGSGSKKSDQEYFISRFARIYTPIVVIMALALALLAPLTALALGRDANFSTWIYRSLSFLVVSCPCALVVSVPLSFFQGLGALYKKGVLTKGSVYIESLAKADVFAFDKTGTLTKGNFAVTKIFPEHKREKIITLSQIAEQNLNHPIAKSICAIRCESKPNLHYTTKNIQGRGVIATNKENTILCGNEKFLKDNGIAFDKAESDGNVVYVAENGEFIGYLVIEDEIKPESADTIVALNKYGSTVMLTGDRKETADRVANELRLSECYSSLLPEDKVAVLEKIKASGKNIAYTGDGINDAPVLRLADVGISMGKLASDAAIEASDIVITNDNLSLIPQAIRVSKKTVRIVKENIYFSISTKLLILALSALGMTNMWFAVFGDVGVALLAILNSFRVKNG